MKYLTRIQLDKGQSTRLRLTDSYAWHQVLWHAFPGHEEDSRQFLFRVDDFHDAFRAYFLSKERPQKTSWGIWETKGIAPGFLRHRRYLFELRANPIFRRVEDKRRIPLLREPDQKVWLNRKAEAGGFKIEDVSMSPPTTQFFTKNGTIGKHVRVDFRGILSVSQSTTFTRTFEKGIGPAKAFGFGMLMLQPIS